MKVISLFYPSTEIRHSISILLFFRMVGIYVTEVYTDFRIIESNDKAILSSDAIVYLQVRESDEKTIDARRYENKFIWVEKWKLEEAETCEIIRRLLDKFKERELIDDEEYADLLAAFSVFEANENQYKEATLLGKYYFEHQESMIIYKISDIYDCIIHQLMDKLKDNNIPIWGQERYSHCRYAFINTLYEMDLFCRKNKLDYYMDMESLVNACRLIDSEKKNCLGNRFKLLQAQIYDQLLDDMPEAFDLYVECCDNSYDAYAYFCKGDIMYKKRTLDRAINYFKQSTYIFPQYYRAWFKLGACYLESENMREYGGVATEAFEHVIKILSERANKNLLRAIEFEYLYNSYMNIVVIKKQLKDFRSALVACDGAFRVYDSVVESRFYTKLDIVDYDHITEDIISHLDVEKLKKEGIELSMLLDFREHAMEYAALTANERGEEYELGY